MKRIVLGGLAVLIALSLVMIAACDLGGIGGGNDNSAYTFDSNGNMTSATATYDAAQGGFVFSALPPPPPSKSARALSDSIAKSSYNLFEVVFVDDSGEAIRASWEYGGSALIQNVTGTTTAAGLDYDGASGNGSAVLFVGKKDMQLLAVGILTHVNGVAGDTLINNASRTVTFTVSSLEAGVWAQSIGAAADIGTVAFTEGGTPIGTFPALVLDTATATALELDYKFRFKGTDSANDEARFTAIKSVGGSPKIYARDPMFFSSGTGNPVIQVKATAALSDGTNDALVPVSAKDPLIAPATGIMGVTEQLTLVPLAGVTPTTGLFSVGFKIPVFALSDDDTNDKPKQWYVATGADENFLDTGSFLSPGGDILVYLGAGAPGAAVTVEIKKTTAQSGIYVVWN